MHFLKPLAQTWLVGLMAIAITVLLMGLAGVFGSIAPGQAETFKAGRNGTTKTPWRAIFVNQGVMYEAGIESTWRCGPSPNHSQ